MYFSTFSTSILRLSLFLIPTERFFLLFFGCTSQINSYISVSWIRYYQLGQVNPISIILLLRIGLTLTGGWNNDKIKDIAKQFHTPVPRISWKGSSFAATVICMHLKRQKLIGIRCVDNREPSEYLLGQEHMVHCFIKLPFTGSKISVRKFELIIKNPTMKRNVYTFRRCLKNNNKIKKK